MSCTARPANGVALRVLAVELYERPVELRLPFRFGVATLRACPQAFARVVIETTNGLRSVGAAAEMMAPKWFDKRLEVSNEQNFEDLRRVTAEARRAYLDHGRPDTAFGYFAAHHHGLIAAGATRALNPLLVNFGAALLDRAILDALCRACQVSIFDAIERNLAGLPVTADEAGVNPIAKRFVDADMKSQLAGVARPSSLAARHTVGLVDAIVDTDPHDSANDGLPESLQGAIDRYGIRHFKLKVSGRIDGDLERLQRIADCLEPLPAYLTTLDGNEQFGEPRAFVEFMRRLAAAPTLRRLHDSIEIVEQPLARAVALTEPIDATAIGKPVIIDESDAELDDFPRAVALGYAGVSSKGCKGIYRSLLNAARCRQAARTGARWLMSAEDLTTQAGLAVQQDLAIAAMIGLGHVERNGHHYVDGFGRAGANETRRFADAHPDLYEWQERAGQGVARLRIHAGRLQIGSLHRPGFASSAHPDFDTLTPMKEPV